MLMPRLARYLKLSKEAAFLWYDKDADFMAATVSYYALFAVTPFLLLTLSLSGLVYGREEVALTFVDWGSVLGPDLIALLSEAVRNLMALSNDFSIPFFGTLFFSGMTIVMFNTFTTGIHNLWGIKHAGFLGWVKKCIHSAFFVVAFQMYLVILVGMYRLIDVLTANYGGAVANVIGALGVITLTTVLFSLMFWLLPWQRPPLPDRLLGAFTAGVLFTIAKFLIALYITLTPVPGLFGAAGVLLALLIWVYVSVAILYFGAAMAYTASHNRLQ